MVPWHGRRRSRGGFVYTGRSNLGAKRLPLRASLAMGGESLFPNSMAADTKALQRKVEVMEKEAQLRQQYELEQQAHNEAVLKCFVERVMTTILAWVSSSMIFSVLALPMREKQVIKPHQAALCQFIYVLLISVFLPAVAFKLRNEAGKTKGNSIKDSFLKLAAAAVPMILLWGWMDLAEKLMVDWEDKSGISEKLVVDNLLMSVGLIAFCAVVAISPPYIRAHKAIKAKDAGDSILARYIYLLPYSLTLATAACIFSVAGWLVGNLTKDFQKDLWNDIPNTVCNYLVLLVPCLIVMILVTVVALAWSLKSAAFSEDVKSIPRTDADSEGAKADKYTAFFQRSVEIELFSGDILVAGCSFVYALCLKAILTTFFYSMLYTCGAACSYPPKFLYAVSISYISFCIVKLLKSSHRNAPWGKALHSMQILALSLVTGWAWLDIVTAWVVAILGSAKPDKTNEVLTLIFVLAFVSFWVLFTLFYHVFLSAKLVWRTEQEAMAKELAEGPWGSAEDTAAAV